MSEQKKDLGLVRKAQAGDKAAFDLLVRKYQNKIISLVSRYLGNNGDVQDVAQDAFVKAYIALPGFRGEAAFYTWLYRIATNETLTFINKRNRTTHLSNEDLHESLVTNLVSDPYFNGDEAQLKLQKAIDTLPTKQKQVFVMKYFDELQYNEISEILGTSEGALKANYHYAVKKITEYVTDN